MKRYFFVALLLLAAGIQTAQAQSMIIRTSDGRLVPYGIEEVDSVLFTDANYAGGHEYIDLGLPSGTLWATCNVGANSPLEYGNYFAWGETQTKDSYLDSNYKFFSDRQVTKYNATDGKTRLMAVDDAASVAFGSKWQMPSKAQWDELLDGSNTTIEWTRENGVNGNKITSNRNGKSIFLPAAGSYTSFLSDAGKEGYYWSRTLNTEQEWEACYMCFDYTGFIGTYYVYRRYGLCVRPVVKQPFLVEQIVLSATSLKIPIDDTQTLTATILPEDADNMEVTWESSSDEVATVSSDGLVTAVAEGTCTITCRATDGSGVYAECEVKVVFPEDVDLGLPSGTLWATYNLGASHPEEYGDYFAWGETQTKDEYSWSTYRYCNGSNKKLTKYCYEKSYGDNEYWDGVTELTSYDDAATTLLGESWVMPSYEQLQELLDNTTHEWTEYNNVKGCLLTSKINGKSIFLPAAGLKNEYGLRSYGSNGYYWTSSLSIVESDFASFLHVYVNDVAFMNNSNRCNGMPIRPVRAMQNPPTPAVRRIIIEDKQLKFDLGEGTTSKVISATILPSKASKVLSWTSSDTGVATVSSSGRVTPVSEGTCTITCTATDGSDVKDECEVTVVRLSGTYNGHEWVDLGLPSGTLWATCNVGSRTPEGPGNKYAWGEVTPKSEYTYANYKWGKNDNYFTKYTYADGNTDGNWYDSNGNFIGDGKRELDPEDDAATYNWGSNWQTPSESQLKEIMYEMLYGKMTYKTWKTVNGVMGYEITSKTTGKSIFLPATDGSAGYWSNRLYNETSNVDVLLLEEEVGPLGNFDFYLYPRYIGKYVRPVVKK